MAVTKQCAACTAQFTYTPPVGFADNRKYCDPCSAQKKASYENRGVPVQTPVLSTGVVTVSNDGKTITNITTPETRDHKFDKDPVGLAVELFVALESGSEMSDKEIMLSCIDLVKMAQGAFE